MIPLIIILILILLIIIVFIFSYIYLKNKIEDFSQKVFGSSNIIEGFKRQELDLQNIPKSVSSLDSVVIPKILEDFPELDINELKSMVEEAVLLYFKSLDNGEVKINNGTECLLAKINSEIESLSLSNERYSDVRFHKTVINSYKKSRGVCVITVQSSLEYIKKGEDIIKVQDRFNTELIYVYDNMQNEELGVSLNCKNCGAPIKSLGNKLCPYCGTGVVINLKKAWKIDKIYHI